MLGQDSGLASNNPNGDSTVIRGGLEKTRQTGLAFDRATTQADISDAGMRLSGTRLIHLLTPISPEQDRRGYAGLLQAIS